MAELLLEILSITPAMDMPDALAMRVIHRFHTLNAVANPHEAHTYPISRGLTTFQDYTRLLCRAC